MRKIAYLLLALTALCLYGEPVGVPVSPAQLPSGKDGVWLSAVPVITFFFTWLLGKIPPLPKWVLPWFTPVVGLLIGIAMNAASSANLPWWSSAGAGAIATTIYEAIKGWSGAGPSSVFTPTPKPNP